MWWRRVVPLASLASLVLACSGPAPAGPAQTVRTFGSGDTPITATGVTADDGGWRIERTDAGAVPLFEVPLPGVESTILTYRARMKASDVKGKAYLEMWVRVPGRGEFFSRGLAQPLQGTGVRADLVKLNVAFEGGGTVWIKDVELLKAGLGS